MAWDLVVVGEALAETISSTGTPAAFAIPPSTVNPPAYVVSYPDLVEFNTTAIKLDTATYPVVAVAGLTTQPADLMELISAARKAIQTDRTLGGAVSNAYVTQLRTIQERQVAGVDLLTAELVVMVDC